MLLFSTFRDTKKSSELQVLFPHPKDAGLGFNHKYGLDLNYDVMDTLFFVRNCLRNSSERLGHLARNKPVTLMIIIVGHMCPLFSAWTLVDRVNHNKNYL